MANQPAPAAEHPERQLERSQEQLEQNPKRTPDSLESVQALIHELHHRLETDPTERALGEAWGDIETATEGLAQENAAVREARERCRQELQNADRDVATTIKRLEALEKALASNQLESPAEPSREAREQRDTSQSERFGTVMNTLMNVRLDKEQSMEVEQRLRTMFDQHTKATEPNLRQANEQLEKLVDELLNPAELKPAVLKVLDDLIEQAKQFNQDTVTETSGDVTPKEQAVEIIPVIPPQEKIDDAQLEAARQSLQALLQQHSQAAIAEPLEEQPTQPVVDEADDGGSDEYDDTPAQAGVKADVAAGTTVVAGNEKLVNEQDQVNQDVLDTFFDMMRNQPVGLVDLPSETKEYLQDRDLIKERCVVQLATAPDGVLVIGERQASNGRVDLGKPYVTIPEPFYRAIENKFKPETRTWLEQPEHRIPIPTMVNDLEAANNTDKYQMAA